MQVDLTRDQLNIIDEALRSGKYHNTTEVLDDALHALKLERLSGKVSDNDRQKAIERLGRFGKQHGLSLEPGVVVKDLINEERR